MAGESSPCRVAGAEDAAAQAGLGQPPPLSQMSLEARPQSEPLACGHRKQLVLIVIE